MSVNRRNEIKIEDLNLYDPDTSVDMFYGQFVKTFPNPRKGKPDVSFIYRRIDPGTLLELTDVALLHASKSDPEAPDEPAPEPTRREQLEFVRTQVLHRLEVLQKCICQPKFENLEQLKKIPTDWQVDLYNLIMHGVMGGDVLTAQRFREKGQRARA